MAASPQFQQLIQQARSSQPQKRIAALEALGRLGDPRAIPALCEALRDSEATLRLASVMALGRIRNERSTAALVGALQDKAGVVRGVTAVVLARLGDPSALSPLERATESEEEPGVRDQMADSVRTLRKAVGERRSAAPGEGNWEAAVLQLKSGDLSAKVKAAQALGSRGKLEAVEPLAALLTEPEATVRIASLIALGKRGDQRTTKRVAQALRDPTPLVRVAAALALRALRDPEAVDPLSSALSREVDETVRRHLQQALSAIQELTRPTKATIPLSPTPAMAKDTSVAPKEEPAVEKRPAALERRASPMAKQSPPPLGVVGITPVHQPRLNEWGLLQVAVLNNSSSPIWVTSVELVGPIQVSEKQAINPVPEGSVAQLSIAAKPTEVGSSVPLVVRAQYRDAAGSVHEVSDLQFITVINPLPSETGGQAQIVVSGDYIAPGGAKASADVFAPKITRTTSSPLSQPHTLDFCPVQEKALSSNTHQYCPFCGAALSQE